MGRTAYSQLSAPNCLTSPVRLRVPNHGVVQPDGSDCFVRLEPDHDTTFKRIYTADEGELIRLQPINPVYEPSMLPREQVSGIYRAAFVMRRVGSCY